MIGQRFRAIITSIEIPLELSIFATVFLNDRTLLLVLDWQDCLINLIFNLKLVPSTLVSWLPLISVVIVVPPNAIRGLTGLHLLLTLLIYGFVVKLTLHHW